MRLILLSLSALMVVGCEKEPYLRNSPIKSSRVDCEQYEEFPVENCVCIENGDLDYLSCER